MCGIGALSLRHQTASPYRSQADINDLRDTFTHMLVNAQSRGSSATGFVMSYYDRDLKKNKVSVIRAPIPASQFVKSQEYIKLINKFSNDTHFLLGHTRAPTGSAPPRNNLNNHPHRSGNIIGVHNGHISNFRKLWKEKLKGLTPDSECDSEVIFALINKYRQMGKSNMEATTQAMSDIEGWYAFSYIDMKEPTTLWFARDNGEAASLECCWMRQMRVALFASEEEIYSSAAIKAGFHKTALTGKLFAKSTIVGINSFVKDDPFDISVETETVDTNVKTEWTEEEKKMVETTRGL